MMSPEVSLSDQLDASFHNDNLNIASVGSAIKIDDMETVFPA